MNRAEALKIIDELIANSNLKKHMNCVEAAMKFYANEFNENEEKWGLAGLLHDADWEKYPEDHPKIIVSQLNDLEVDPDVVQAIASHGNDSEQYGYGRFTDRQSLMDKALFAVDELSGFVIACALVRPTKLEGLEARSVIKKLKDKSFAAQVSRDDIYEGAKELNIDLEAHVQNVINALQGIKEELGL